MSHLRNALRAGLLLLPLAVLAAACARKPDGERAAAADGPAAQAEPIPITAEEAERPSLAASVVAAFAAVCAEPAPRPVARAAAARGFAPFPREEKSAAALPADAPAWRGPAELGGVMLLWDPDTSTCELRARGLDAVVVGAEFAKLPLVLEEGGASVMPLPPPPVRPGAARTRQMLLVSPGGGPERARVLRLSDDGATAAPDDALVLSARGVAAAMGRR